jgi:hypothetical protein
VLTVSMKLTNDSTRIKINGAPSAQVLLTGCEGSPRALPFATWQGADFACTPSNSLWCRRRVERCPRFAAGTGRLRARASNSGAKGHFSAHDLSRCRSW